MFCLVRNIFVISTSATDCPRRFVSEMTCYVSSGTLNPTIFSSLSIVIHHRLHGSADVL